MDNLFVGIILLICSIIVIILIYLIAQNNFLDKILLIQNLGVVGVPNPEFFRFFFPFFILVTCIALFIGLDYPGMVLRWVGILIISLLTAFLLFGRNDFNLWPLATLSIVILIVLLGETIFRFGIDNNDKMLAGMVGFFFLWAVYALYLNINILITVTSLYKLPDNILDV